MSDESDKAKKRDKLASDLTTTGALVATAMTAATLAGASPSATAVAAGMAAVPALVDRMRKAIMGRSHANADAFWERVVSAVPGRTVEEVAGLLEAHAEEPWVAETIFEAHRQVTQNPSRAVAVAIGTLTATYIGEKRELDAFFRGLSRLLADLTAEEACHGRRPTSPRRRRRGSPNTQFLCAACPTTRLTESSRGMDLARRPFRIAGT